MKKRRQKGLTLNKYRIAKLIDPNQLRGGTNTNTTDVDSNTNPITMTNCDNCDTTNPETESCTCGPLTATTNPTGVTMPPPPGGTTGIAGTLDCP
ncbi:hypothetical protein GTQ40_00455 [Flavobacteriaceae bacterium R38]|nr:hypothetical protein [Flavobacteriaceae bacterium R38]